MESNNYRTLLTNIKLRSRAILDTIIQHTKEIPLKFKLLYLLAFLLFIYLWGLTTEFVLAIVSMNITILDPLPHICFTRIFTSGFRNSLAGVLFPLGLTILFFGWYFRNHLHDPEIEIV